MARFELPSLPYGYDALAPTISAETLQFHHDKHHKAYVDKLNELLPSSGMENASLEEIVLQAQGALFNQAGQHWNHTFYWNSMSPKSRREPQGKLADAIKKAFGGFDPFKQQFEQKAVGIFGSGWAWLCSDAKGEVSILQTKDADTPIRHKLNPLFTADVWEHAYYIDYRNGRAKYLAEFWKVLNWEFAEANYAKAAK